MAALRIKILSLEFELELLVDEREEPDAVLVAALELDAFELRGCRGSRFVSR